MTLVIAIGKCNIHATKCSKKEEKRQKLKIMSPATIRDKMTMNKNVGVKVCDVFDGERYHGEVTEVIYHDVHAQYMYRVVFSDNDCCDYWRHELELVKWRCESNSDSDA